MTESDQDGVAPAAGGRGRAGHERETSIRRGVEVLLSLASDEALTVSGLGVTRISELLGREKSQVSRALKALAEYGLVARDDDGAYRLGWRLFALGQLAGERRLLDLAGAPMRRLATSLGERTHLSVLQGTETLTVLSESTGRTVEAAGWAGRSTPAYCTSAGRALLLDWAREDILAAFAPVAFDALGPHTVSSPAALADAVAEGRELGHVIVDEEFEPDLIGIGAPIRDGSGAIIAALNVSAPRHRFLKRVPQAIAELREAATQLSLGLSDRDPALPAGA